MRFDEWEQVSDSMLDVYVAFAAASAFFAGIFLIYMHFRRPRMKRDAAKKPLKTKPRRRAPRAGKRR